MVTTERQWRVEKKLSGPEKRGEDYAVCAQDVKKISALFRSVPPPKPTRTERCEALDNWMSARRPSGRGEDSPSPQDLQPATVLDDGAALTTEGWIPWRNHQAPAVRERVAFFSAIPTITVWTHAVFAHWSGMTEVGCHFPPPHARVPAIRSLPWFFSEP